MAGYQPIMPTYKGQLSEDDVMQIVAYIKSIGGQGATATGAPPSQAAPSGTVPATRASETTTPNTTSTAN